MPFTQALLHTHTSIHTDVLARSVKDKGLTKDNLLKILQNLSSEQFKEVSVLFATQNNNTTLSQHIFQLNYSFISTYLGFLALPRHCLAIEVAKAAASFPQFRYDLFVFFTPAEIYAADELLASSGSSLHHLLHPYGPLMSACLTYINTKPIFDNSNPTSGVASIVDSLLCHPSPAETVTAATSLFVHGLSQPAQLQAVLTSYYYRTGYKLTDKLHFLLDPDSTALATALATACHAGPRARALPTRRLVQRAAACAGGEAPLVVACGHPWRLFVRGAAAEEGVKLKLGGGRRGRVGKQLLAPLVYKKGKDTRTFNLDITSTITSNTNSPLLTNNIVTMTVINDNDDFNTSDLVSSVSPTEHKGQVLAPYLYSIPEGSVEVAEINSTEENELLTTPRNIGQSVAIR